ncbi:DUF5058 family protein [Peptoniphilus equinus]|uniref:DUF5058 family protein n=1 Tax=Peptoniphilus equinus TaxID=3016343 RepID=A0ABY7QRV4_9FIRM|nr:DUF5058 family protein [Peptoniphilus equinus]WBW49519.1 DUF5058 family protein [Peptoniphilus equinus]
MSIFDVLNSKVLYIAVFAALAIIFAMCVFFFLRARRRVLELGVKKGELNEVLKSSVIFSVIPSISVIIGLISLAPLLGTPWPWFRLSVVGALAYELMSADLAVKGVGYESLAAFSQTGSIDAIGTIMFVMSLSIMSGMVFNVFFLDKIHKRVSQVGQKQDKFVALALSTLIIGMMAVFVPMQLIASKIHAITLIASALLTYVLTRLSKKVPWLSDYIMSFALIFGMAVAVMATRVL